QHPPAQVIGVGVGRVGVRDAAELGGGVVHASHRPLQGRAVVPLLQLAPAQFVHQEVALLAPAVEGEVQVAARVVEPGAGVQGRVLGAGPAVHGLIRVGGGILPGVGQRQPVAGGVVGHGDGWVVGGVAVLVGQDDLAHPPQVVGNYVVSTTR